MKTALDAGAENSSKTAESSAIEVINVVEEGRGGYETALKALMLDAVGDSVVVHDLGGNFIYCNRAAHNMHGYTREEFLELNLRDILADDSSASLEKRLSDLADKGCHQVESTNIRKDGTRFPVEIVSKLVNIEGERYILSVARDISERKEAQTRIQKLLAAVEQSASIVVSTDLKANITYLNRAFTRATGYAKEEVLGQNPRILKSGWLPDDEYSKMWNTLTAGGEWRGVFRNKRKNGTLYWEHAVISLVKDGQGRPEGYLAIKEDITERKALEEERETLIDELQGALDRIKTLKGIIPVCASCRKIRNDQGYWQQVDIYIREHTGADVSHCLCRECAEKLYPDFAKGRSKDGKEQ